MAPFFVCILCEKPFRSVSLFHDVNILTKNKENLFVSKEWSWWEVLFVFNLNVEERKRNINKIKLNKDPINSLCLNISDILILWIYLHLIKTMGKKFIVLQSQHKKYRLLSEDIKTVFIKSNRRIPKVPKFPPACKNFE